MQAYAFAYMMRASSSRLAFTHIENTPIINDEVWIVIDQVLHDSNLMNHDLKQPTV